MKSSIIVGNIISPLGFSTTANYEAVKLGLSEIEKKSGLWNLPFDFMASIVNDEILEDEFQKSIKSDRISAIKLTKFEKMALLSAVKSIESCNVDAAAERTLFILSSTKGNVAMLGDEAHDRKRVFLSSSAKIIAEYFGNKNTPIVISNACISGLCAQIEAHRQLMSGKFDHCIVIGAEQLSPFIVSGFNCLKALSDEQCKPFSINRKGLNLGEAAASMVIAAGEKSDSWKIVCGAIRNDANHISGPSRTGEGSFRALQYVLEHGNCNIDDLACINVHGTATIFNDEMESIAISRAQLSDIPTFGLKGYFGHTLGAAGILESLITMTALDDGIIPATRGFDSSGVSGKISLSDENRTTEKRNFIKLLSGFGGCNAAVMFSK